jgi:hypothetical protein
MVDFSALPWWAGVYLLIYFGLNIVGAVSGLRENKISIVGDFMSFIFACFCVFAYVDAEFAHALGYWLVPMVVIGLGWEFSQAVRDSNRAETEMREEHDIPEEDRTFILNIGVGTGALIVLPAYMMGAKACFDLFFPTVAG